jgi:hypothetical protein
MRRILTFGLILVGFALQAIAYLALAAPIGQPTDVSFSEPRMPFAPLVFIVGVGMVFASAIVYELLPDRRRRDRADR